jgi:hypothetical protein
MLRLLLKKGADRKRLDMGGFNASSTFSCSDQERIHPAGRGFDVNAAHVAGP